MPDQNVERRLVAILSADVAGYSRLMADDEQATVRAITAYRGQIGSLVPEHHGRLVDATGDNALAEFPTALDAVEAALEIQRVLKARNARLPKKRRMEFRIGIHLGDVAVRGERIYGDGVNVAARLQSLAEPGGICVSGAVHEQIDTKVPVGSEDLGERPVKNVPRPVRVFRIREQTRPGIDSGVPGTSDRSSIVVLPFADMSPAQDQEYFCDGMAEEVINALTHLENLHVVARTSAFAFKGRDLDVREIGKELSVANVLEGSVRKAGDQLRVTAQLIDVDSGYHLWSERFDRRLDDVFAIQDEISANIVDALEIRLAIGPAEPTVGRTKSRQAHDLYLRGLYHLGTDARSGYQQAADYCDKARSIDPDYAAAHSIAAIAHTRLATVGHLPSALARPKAKSAATTAVELDDSLSIAHQAHGAALCWFDWAWDRGIEAFQPACWRWPTARTACRTRVWSCGSSGFATASRMRRQRPCSPPTTKPARPVS